jgi:hypothetical protein
MNMKSPAEIIDSIRQSYDPETLDLQIRYCETVLRASMQQWKADDQGELEPPTQVGGVGDAETMSARIPPTGVGGSSSHASRPKNTHPSASQANVANQQLAMLIEARQLLGLLVKMTANLKLGEQSPWADDAEVARHDYHDVYDRYSDARMMIKPRRTGARARLHAQTREQEPPTQVGGIRASHDAASATPPTRAGGSSSHESRATPDDHPLVRALVEWQELARQWLEKGDDAAPLAPPPQELMEALEHDAPVDRQAEQTLETIKALLAMVKQRNENARIRAEAGLHAGPGGARPATAA